MSCRQDVGNAYRSKHSSLLAYPESPMLRRVIRLGETKAPRFQQALWARATRIRVYASLYTIEPSRRICEQESQLE